MKSLTICLVVLGLLVLACEQEQNLPKDFLQACELELSDGFCLVSDDRVILNHHQIEYYDFSSHIVYLESDHYLPVDFEELGVLSVYADEEKVYDITIQKAVSSYLPPGPMIWSPAFFGEQIIHIDHLWDISSMAQPEAVTDLRRDERVVEVLKKYGQFHEGLKAEIISVAFHSSNSVVLELELSNEDSFDYYYLDPEKMGSGLYHYFTNGLFLWDGKGEQTYNNNVAHIQPEPWDSWNLEWMSLLKSQESKTLFISYGNFDAVPVGEYSALFSFPGLSYQVDRDQVEQNNGQVWLGDLDLSFVLTID